MQPGDLVRYRFDWSRPEIVGILLQVNRSRERAKVQWNDESRNDEVWDWLADLERVK